MHSTNTPRRITRDTGHGLSREYASHQDFCAIFSEHVDGLYSLALLLTADHDLSRQAFLAALEDCAHGPLVFREWARSWSRRAVIKSAIALVGPSPSGMPAAGEKARSIAREMHPAARPLMKLATFDRFVFAMSVLEGYSVRECAALLNVHPREIESARARALQQIATFEDGRSRTALAGSALHFGTFPEAKLA